MRNADRGSRNADRGMLNPKSFRISFNEECATPVNRARGDDGCPDSAGECGSVPRGDGRGNVARRVDRLAGGRAGDARRESGDGRASLPRAGAGGRGAR